MSQRRELGERAIFLRIISASHADFIAGVVIFEQVFTLLLTNEMFGMPSAIILL